MYERHRDRLKHFVDQVGPETNVQAAVRTGIRLLCQDALAELDALAGAIDQSRTYWHHLEDSLDQRAAAIVANTAPARPAP